MREPDNRDDQEDTIAPQNEFELNMIEAACRAVGNGRGAITRIRVCLPVSYRREPDLSVQRHVERWGKTFAVSTVVEREGEMSVVLIGPEIGTEE